MYKVNSTSYDNVDVVAATMLAMPEVAIAGKQAISTSR